MAASARTYLWTWLGLLALAGLSFGLSFAPLGGFGPPVALTIGVIKAVLIAAFFMHLVEQPSVSRWTFGVGLLLVLVLVVMVAIDVVTRPSTGLVQPGLESARPLTSGTGQ